MQKLNIRMVLHIHTLMYTCVISSYTSLRYESDTLKASFSHCLLDNPQCVLPNIGARILYVWRHMIAEKVELDYDITFTRTTETRVKWLGQEQLLSTKVNDPALIQRLLGEGQKLNIEKPSHEKDNHLKTMPKTNDTISISDVSAMLCELGIGLSQHFGLDADEVVQFLDTACEDQLGVNPGTCELFEQVKAEVDKVETNDKYVLLRTRADEGNGSTVILAVTASQKDAIVRLLDYSKKLDEIKDYDIDDSCKKYKVLLEKFMQDPAIIGDVTNGRFEIEQLSTFDPDNYSWDHDNLSDVRLLIEDGIFHDKDEPNQPTKGQIEEWCQPPNKGGVSIKVLREKASEMDINVSELKKRSEIKEALLRGLDDGEASTDLVVKRNKELGCWVVHVDGEPTNLVVQSYHVKKLIGYITKQGKLSKKIPKTVQEKAIKLGLD